MNTPAATGSPAHQVIYFPYLGLTRGEELRFGQLEVWSASRLTERVASENIRTRVRELLDSHRAPAGRLGKARPLKGIGVVSRGASDLAPLIPEWATEIQELRQALFLAGLSNNVGLQGENAGHWMYTAENFSFVAQGFSLDSPYFGETTGAIVSFNMLGYRIGEVEFPTPS